MSNALSQQFKQIDEILKSAHRVVVASHENPDADAVASVLSLHYILKKEKRESLPYLPSFPNQNLSFLPGFFEIKTEIANFKADLLFCLDYGDFKRLRIPEYFLAENSPFLVTLDHHVESDQRGEVKVLEPEFSSTAEIIYHWLKYKNIAIDKAIATCLLSGIFSDSGGFCHVSTSSQTLKIVSELLLKGASLNQIARQILTFNKPLNITQAWGQVLSRTTLDPKTGLAYSWLTPEEFQRFKVRFTDFKGITNLISAGSLQSLGLFLVEYQPGKIKGSLRSEPQAKRNALEIAKALGGGGHSYAAGFYQDGTVQDILKKVLDLIG